MVAVYYTAPNVRLAMQGMLRNVFSGTKPTEEEAKKSIAAVPRITYADTLTLARGADGWRVHVGLAHQRALRDSLHFDVLLEDHGFGAGFITGSVENRSATPVYSVSAEIFDAKGESHSVSISEITAHGMSKVIEMARLAPGRPSRIVVRQLRLKPSEF